MIVLQKRSLFLFLKFKTSESFLKTIVFSENETIIFATKQKTIVYKND